MDKFCIRCDEPTDHYLSDPVLMRYTCSECLDKPKEEQDEP
jgi:hypothetical protein